MGKPKTQAPIRLSKVAVTLTTLTTSISLENFKRAEANVVQAPQPAEFAASESQSLPFGVQPMRPRFCEADLKNGITSIVNNPTFKTAKWGIVIKPIAEPGSLYQHNPNINLIPASNIKLLTTAAVLQFYTENRPEKLASLGDLLTAVNRYSNNPKANLLLRRIGGKKAAMTALSNLGVDTSAYQQVDGSGLSRNNRATPSTLVGVLERMYVRRPNEVNAENSLLQKIQAKRDLFYNSLAIAGVNGTLRGRFLNTPVQGRLFGKTGTLRGVRSLSGYLENPDYGTIAFSIVVNQPGQSGQRLTQAIDRILLKTSQVNRC
ncbi:D-alanyl-D-alanine carboxypeptidase [Calothrix sp. PCC 6303]|uniref:D-alanyl-D-alanine carboxypeptidase n=1 Tax=Calothrix sp. PCC 6303 TaxID=1170562 RepID=UPI0002A01A23|nr:D-alanyl-D-alanine carboxypeptidase [Calothrix sp. PCC 6303]AFY99303.1 peptidase S13 D-Ala-D-Ala carboxypeptidase C [Calothrix sp. PCC 6303]